MKLLYPIAFACLFAGGVHAQPTLTYAGNGASVGESFGLVSITSLPSGARASGPNQTWDFSGIAGTAGSLTYDVAINGQDGANHPAADMVELEAGGTGENYVVIGPTGHTYTGHYIDNVQRVVYTDLRENWVFPMSFGDVANETFSGSAELFAASITYLRAGDVTITADAHGDLILPYTTASNVLRICTVVDYTDNLNGFDVASYVDTIYSWWNANTHWPLATATISTINGASFGEFGSHIAEADFVSGVNDALVMESPYTMFPNPASESVTFVDAPAGAVATISDLSGKVVVPASPVSGQGRLDIAVLPAGIYLVRIADRDQHYVERLIVN